MISYDNFAKIFPDATLDDYADALVVMVFTGAANNPLRAAIFLSFMPTASSAEEIGRTFTDLGLHRLWSAEIGVILEAIHVALPKEPACMIDRLHIFHFVLDHWTIG